MKQISVLILCALCAVICRAQYVPSDAVKQTQQQFQDDKFGIFIHWGIYSMMGDGEWVQQNKNLNYAEYQHLADGFYPSKFDADAWVKAFKDAGARYMTITSRHHDGFSMFQTKEDTYNIVDGTPFGRDVLKEIAEACARHGLRLHLYYSHLDWHRLDYPLGRTGRGVGRPTDQQNFDSYFAFMNSQLRELLTGYGKIDCIWFDGEWDHQQDATPFDWRLSEQYALIHSLQPQCMVANNHHHTPWSGEDMQIFEQDLPGENRWNYASQGVSQLPLESCLTMNNTWGYDIKDKGYKTADELIRSLVKTAGRNGNLLLNIGPRPDGQLPVEALQLLQELGEWLKVNGETIYGTRGGCVPPQPWGVTTQRGKTLFVHILDQHTSEMYIPVGKEKVKSVKYFATKQSLQFTKTIDGIVVKLTEEPRQPDTILELKL